MNDNTQDIYNLIRGVTKPFPGAFLFKDNSKLTIWEAVPFDKILDFSEYNIGEIIQVTNDEFILKLKDGTLLVKEFEYNDEIKEGDILK